MFIEDDDDDDDDDDDKSLSAEYTWVKFVYEGHRIKVEVSGTKSRKPLFSQCITFIAHNSGSIKNRAI